MREPTEARIYAALPTLFVGLFFALPVVLLLLSAIRQADRGILEALLRLATTPFYTNRILFTFEQALLSTGLTLLLGVPLAYLFSHCHWPGRRTMRATFTAPFVLPSLVVAIAFQAWMGPHGVLGFDLLTPLGPLGSILLAHVFYNTSLVIRLVGNYWERLPDAYVEAAQTLGQAPRRIFWRIDLPLLRPALAAAALLTFVFTFTSFGLILLLAGPHTGTLETLIYQELKSFRPDYATAALLAVLQLLITYAAALSFVRVQRRLTTTWRPKIRLERRSLPRWGWPMLALGFFLFAGPPLALGLASVRTSTGWGIHGYQVLFSNQLLGTYTALDALANSFRFGAATLVLALLLGLLAALSAHRAKTAWTQSLLLLPLGLSPVVVGLGFLLTWNGNPLPDLRTSGLWIILAHTLVAFPFAARVLVPSLDAIDRPLRESAQTLGAGSARVLARLEIPLSYPALGVAAVFAFGTSLGEFGAALLLRRPETTTIPLAIFDAFSRPGPIFREQAYALATLLLVFAFASFLLLERARVRAWGDFA